MRFLQFALGKLSFIFPLIDKPSGRFVNRGRTQPLGRGFWQHWNGGQIGKGQPGIPYLETHLSRMI